MNQRFTEAAVKKAITKVTNKFIKEHKDSFKNDLMLTVEYITPVVVRVQVDFNKFLSDNPHDLNELLMMEKELSELETGALKVDTSYYHAGAIAKSIIKRGLVIDGECLLSHVNATFTFASNFK